MSFTPCRTSLAEQTTNIHPAFRIETHPVSAIRRPGTTLRSRAFITRGIHDTWLNRNWSAFSQDSVIQESNVQESAQVEVKAKLLVGADGAYSAVRRACLDDGPPQNSVTSPCSNTLANRHEQTSLTPGRHRLRSLLHSMGEASLPHHTTMSDYAETLHRGPSDCTCVTCLPSPAPAMLSSGVDASSRKNVLPASGHLPVAGAHAGR